MSFISTHPIATITLLLAAAAAVVVLRFVIKIHRKDPTVWAGEMRRFDKFARRDGVPSDVIVFTGSSSIRYWSTLAADMSPLPVLNRGFGGSQIDDVTYYAERAVLRYKPRAIVFYAGENDMSVVTKGVGAARTAGTKDAIFNGTPTTTGVLPQWKSGNGTNGMNHGIVLSGV